MDKLRKFRRESRRIAVLAALCPIALAACSSDMNGSAGAAGAPVTSDGGGGRAVTARAGMSNATAGAAATPIGGSGGSTSGSSIGGEPDSKGGASFAAGAGGISDVAGSSGVGGVVAADSGAGGVTTAGAGGSAAGGPALPPACKAETPVSFQKDIQGFLAASCGKGVNGGCHVTDSNKTNLGYNHAYDWITAVAHTGSCGKSPPYAKRFEVVMAVIDGAKPSSCPNSRKMPPPDSGAPALTACNIAALRAWLAEPQVLQTHVAVNDETAQLYPAGPYAMPPFN